MVYEYPSASEPAIPLPRPKPERPKPTGKAKSGAEAKAPPTEPAEPSAPVEPPAAETWKLEMLAGMTQAETRERLGAPSFEEDATPAKIWLYTAESCSVRIYFFPEVKSLTYRVLRYEVLGDSDVEQCVAEIRKEDESGADLTADERQTS